MQKHSSFLHYVRERLEQWADWYIRGNDFGLGYPKCSIEYRMRTEGRMQKRRGVKPLPSNEAAEEVENLIKEMAEHHNRLMADAIRCQYLVTGTLRTRANRLNVSHSGFKSLVDMGEQWLTGRLSTKKRIFQNYSQS
ncbi:MAG: hypothetical protein QM752_00205 [Gammaproteobacteria bacterium]